MVLPEVHQYALAVPVGNGGSALVLVIYCYYITNYLKMSWNNKHLLLPTLIALSEPLLGLLNESADAPMVSALHVKPYSPLLTGTSHLDLLSQTVLQVPISPPSLPFPFLLSLAILYSLPVPPQSFFVAGQHWMIIGSFEIYSIQQNLLCGCGVSGIMLGWGMQRRKRNSSCPWRVCSYIRDTDVYKTKW